MLISYRVTSNKRRRQAMYKLPMMKASEVSKWCKALKGHPVLLLDIERRIRQNVWANKKTVS